MALTWARVLRKPLFILEGLTTEHKRSWEIGEQRIRVTRRLITDFFAYTKILDQGCSYCVLVCLYGIGDIC